jgi:translocation and assembly module TamB
MAQESAQATATAEIPLPAKRRRWRIHHVLAGLVATLILILGAGIVWLDSNSGHRFVINRIAQVAPESGLRIGIGRIEGSIYRKAVLYDVKLYDPKGMFLSAPEIRLDWWPVSWLSNRLSIDDLNIPTARLYRVWSFNPSKAPSGKILPDFDIRIMRLKVGRLEVDKAVTGRADVFAIDGDADIRDGRALVDLSARALRGKDRLLLALDSRPDNNRFDIDLTVNAPKGGLLAAMAGLQQDANLRLEGDGDWALWKGRLVATLDGQSAAGLTIEQRKGDYHLEGAVAGSAIASKGLLARLSSPNLALTADGHFEKRLLSGRFQAKSDAIVVDVKGGIHLGGRGYDNLLIDVGLSKPAALLRNFSASGLIARLRLDGPMDNVRFGYLLRADRLQFDKTILRGVNAMGEGRSDASIGVTQIPLALSAKAIDGQGDLVSTILRNASITGTLQKRGDIITSGPLRLRSDKLNGQLVALFDLKSGRYDFGLTGDIKGLLIPGLGIVDVSSRVKAVPGRGGAFSLTGIVGADVRRLDNAFFRTLGGGLPRLKSDIALGADGRLLLRNLTLRAPLLQFSGEGVRNPDGTIRITGKGVHKSYGPLRIELSGALDRPKVDLVLARPFDAAGLADVHAVLEPYADGYHFTAQGQSTLGPFTGAGDILLPRGGNAVIDVRKLAVGGVEGKGRIEVVTGGLAGRIDFTGPAAGPVELSVINGLQAIKADFRFRQARFAGATPIEIARGRLQSNILLDPAGVKMGVNFRGGGITLGGARISRMTIDADLVDGAGKVNASLSGQRGRLFDLQLAADVAPDDIRATIRGTLDRQPISLDRRAHLRRVEGGWALDPVAIRYRGGEARILSATFGHETRVDLGLKSLSLSLLDITNSDLGLGGMISGRVTYSQVGSGVPSGSASVRISGLTRSGTTRTSTPVDVGLNAELNADRLAVRALISQKGTVIGKAQALLSPLGSGGLIDRLRAAPVRAQVRYVGPADALWRLSTIEIVDITGPIAQELEQIL